MRSVIFYALLAAALFAQTQTGVSPTLRFEVASLKPTAGQARGGGIRPAPGGQRYLATNCPIKVMIQVAYRVKADQIVGGPGWLDTDPFDMEAKAEKPSSADELHVMLMNMLVDRLQLKFHHEKKEMRMYALTAGQNGPRLTAHEAASAGDPWIDVTQSKPLHIQMKAASVPLDCFAFRLSQLLDLPVVDLTGMRGGYDFSLEYTQELPVAFPEGGKLNGEEPDRTGPTVFQAVKQQLGLELKAQRGPVDVIVIDHVERPTSD